MHSDSNGLVLKQYQLNARIHTCMHADSNGLILKQYQLNARIEVHALISTLERGEIMLYAATEVCMCNACIDLVCLCVVCVYVCMEVR